MYKKEEPTPLQLKQRNVQKDIQNNLSLNVNPPNQWNQLTSKDHLL